MEEHLGGRFGPRERASGESCVPLGTELQITPCDRGIAQHFPALPFPFSRLTEVLCSSSSGILPPTLVLCLVSQIQLGWEGGQDLDLLWILNSPLQAQAEVPGNGLGLSGWTQHPPPSPSSGHHPCQVANS